jgi:hypothetical protein
VTLDEAAKRARAKADVSLDPFDHVIANAMEGALHAEQHPPVPPGDTSDLPPWSVVSKPYGKHAAGALNETTWALLPGRRVTPAGS